MAALAAIYALPPDEQPAVVVLSVARIHHVSDEESERLLYALASQLTGYVDIIIAHGFGDDFDKKGGTCTFRCNLFPILVIIGSDLRAAYCFFLPSLLGVNADVRAYASSDNVNYIRAQPCQLDWQNSFDSTCRQEAWWASNHCDSQIQIRRRV